MKPGEEDLMLEAGKYPDLKRLRDRLRRARQDAADDGAWPKRPATQKWLQAEYDKAFEQLKAAVQKKMDAEGERQAQQLPGRET